ncbi:MAG: MoxR family ATPase [Clostridiaceae bacterium]|jgi:MoxR-like ATPase|nr:MoxR family ATPase [Clostridiaceae bacterium]
MNNDLENAVKLCERIETNIGRVIVGKEDTIRLIVIALTARGHLLIEDVPGIGKTTMVRALAKSLDLQFSRIQFTPDVMPSDVTGYNVYNPVTGEFDFRPGAVMTQILLADEINRTSPKTQSSLLEAMQENQVTVDRVTYPLPEPFMVLATQNPIEQQGTYILPEAQLDRFMMLVSLGYPTYEEEIDILNRFSEQEPLTSLESVASSDDVFWLQNMARLVFVSDPIKQYISQLAQKTRSNRDIELGISPRATLMLMQAAKANALLEGRAFVIPDDIQQLFLPVLQHRILVRAEGRVQGADASQILSVILKQVPVPTRQ